MCYSYVGPTNNVLIETAKSGRRKWLWKSQGPHSALMIGRDKELQATITQKSDPCRIPDLTVSAQKSSGSDEHCCYWQSARKTYKLNHINWNLMYRPRKKKRHLLLIWKVGNTNMDTSRKCNVENLWEISKESVMICIINE